MSDNEEISDEDRNWIDVLRNELEASFKKQDQEVAALGRERSEVTEALVEPQMESIANEDKDA